MSKTRNLFSKVFMIGFLVMVVVGFTVPIVLNNITPEENSYVEPRVCQTDTDCALMCEEKPVAVLCGQNLCQQNACTQQSYYPFAEKPLVFSLKMDGGNGSVDLSLRADKNNFFVTFEQEKVKVYTTGLTLAQILEKARVKMNAQCVVVDVMYCANDEKAWVMRVNGEESVLFEYTPQEGDKIELVYS